MRGRNDFSDRTLTCIINHAAKAVSGVETISSSWAEIGTRSYPRCDFRVDIASGVIQVDSYLAVSWPAPVADVAAQVQRNVHTWLKAMTGLEATRIDVVVEQTVPGARRITATDLASTDRVPTIATFSVRPSMPVRSPVTDSQTPVSSPVTAAAQPLKPVSVRPLPEPASPTVPSPVPMRDIAALEPREVVSPRPARPPELKPITAPPARPVSSPQVPPPLRLAAVSVPPLQRVASATIPPAFRLTEVRRPRGPKIHPVTTPSPRRLIQPTPAHSRPLIDVTPPSLSLRPITVDPHPVRSIPLPVPLHERRRRRVR